MQAFLRDGFAYDRWASQKWLECIPTLPFADHAFEIFDHMLLAQTRWLARCGYALTAVQRSREEQLEALFESWLFVLNNQSVEELITYKNLSGEEFTQPIGEIVRHVISHGTYHRGHLRGLAEAAGFDAFPETDMILFFRQKAAQ